MQRGIVYENGLVAGVLESTSNGHFAFIYDDAYFDNKELPAISLTLPKTQRRYESAVLFPFFYGLLAEGVNKDTQCRLLRIDEDDDFTRLLKNGGY